jgi:uncharacterized protein with PIN domain
MSGTCPHCNNIISDVKVELVNALEPLGTSWKSAMFTCPHCNKILNVSFDATAHTKNIINEVTKNILKALG